MTEYTKIHNELKLLGWTPEQGKGDHIIFRKAGKENIVVSMQVSDASRAFKNCLADIRSKEPDFRLGKPSRKKGLQAQEDTGNIPADSELEMTAPMAPETKQYDRAFVRNYKWISAGTKVVMAENAGEIYTVTGIESSDGRNVLEDTDIIHLLSETGAETQVFPEDIDCASQRKCTVCGQYRPMNWFGTWYKTEEKRNTCRECLQPAKTEESTEATTENIREMEQTKEPIMTQNCSELADKITEGLSAMLFDEAAGRISAKGCSSPREYNRKIDADITKMIDKIKVKIKSMDFSKVPSEYMWCEIMRRGEMMTNEDRSQFALSPAGTDSFLKTIDSDKLLQTLLDRGDMSREVPEKVSLADTPSQDLFDELKSRGFKIVEGKFKRIIEETLE